MGNPIGVIPFVVIEARYDRAGVGAKFGAEGVGIGLEREDVAAGANDFIFVDGALVELGEKYFRVSFIQPMFHLKLKPSPPR